MDHRLSATVRNVKLQIPAEGHVDHLHPAADPEHGELGALERTSYQLNLELVPFAIYPVHHRVLTPAVKARVDVAAAREHDPVDAVEQSLWGFRRRYEKQRDATGKVHGADVAGGKRERWGVAVGCVGGDSDDGALLQSSAQARSK